MLFWHRFESVIHGLIIDFYSTTNLGFRFCRENSLNCYGAIVLKPFLRRRSSIEFMSDYSSEFKTSSQLLFGQVSAANSAQPIISMAWNLFCDNIGCYQYTNWSHDRAYHFNKSFSMSTFISPLRPHSILIYLNRSFAIPTFICPQSIMSLTMQI